MSKSPSRTGVALLLGAAGIIALTSADCRRGPDAEATTRPATGPAAGEEKHEPGHVALTPEQVEHAGIKTEPVKPGTLRPELRLFGVIQEDPGSSFVVRAPAAGVVEAAEGSAWPRIGQALADGAPVGVLRPRPMPSDQITIASQRVTLQTQIAAARAELETATASLDAARKAYERQKELNANEKAVSDRIVEEAYVKMRTEEARVNGAQQTLNLAMAALPAQSQAPLDPMPMSVARGGQVAEVTARPGESVESGQPVLRVVRLDQAVAAVDLPAVEGSAPQAKEARIVPVGKNAKPLTGTLVGAATASDPKTKGRVLLYRISAEGPDAPTPPPPGTPVTAYIPTEGEALKGVTVPEAAVVRYLGKAWVYVAESDKEFERREVSLDQRGEGGKGWFVLEGFKGDERVVTVGAQVLLSTEINEAFGGGGE